MISYCDFETRTTVKSALPHPTSDTHRTGRILHSHCGQQITLLLDRSVHNSIGERAVKAGSPAWACARSTTADPRPPPAARVLLRLASRHRRAELVSAAAPLPAAPWPFGLKLAASFGSVAAMRPPKSTGCCPEAGRSTVSIRSHGSCGAATRIVRT